MDFFFLLFYFPIKIAPCKYHLPGSRSWRRLGGRLALNVSLAEKHTTLWVSAMLLSAWQWVRACAVSGSGGSWRGDLVAGWAAMSK